MHSKRNRKITAKMTGIFLSVAMLTTSVPCPVYADLVVEEIDIQTEEVWEDEPQEVVEDIKDEVRENAQEYDGWDLNEQEDLEKALRSRSVTLDRNASVYEENVGAFSRQNIVDIAKSQVGVSGRPNTYTRWLGTIGGSYSYAWCHAFASWCGAQAGGSKLVPITASSSSQTNDFAWTNPGWYS